eukprot:jgi/Orpsp1_1/1176253/evm.model.c7180000056952.2
MKRSLKELKERQRKKRQNNIDKSTNRLTSYGFKSSRINSSNQNNIDSQIILPKDSNNSSKNCIPTLKRSQSLNIIPNNKKFKSEDENTINTLISSHLKKSSFSYIASFNPLKHSRSYNEIQNKKINKNPFQDLNSDNTIVLDPFSLLKNLSKVDNEENDKDIELKNGLNNLSSNIFNIEYLNLENNEVTEPLNNKDKKNKNSFEEISKNNKINILKVDEAEFTTYNSRYIIESDDEDEISLSEKESVASDTDIRDILQNEDDEDDEDENFISNQSLSKNIETPSNTENNYKNNKDNVKEKSSVYLLDILKQNKKISTDTNITSEEFILKGLKSKKSSNNEEQSKKVLDGNNFRDQLNLKNLKQEESLPYDYTIKKKITFYSNSSFDWNGEQTTQDESECLKAFVKDIKINDIYKRIQQLLYYYVYPTNQLSISSIKVLQKVLWKAKNKDLNDLMNNSTISEDEKEEIQYYKKIDDEWKQSFRSLYFSLKNRLTDSFYYINSDFSVLFLSNNIILNSNSYQAVLTNSTSYIKSLLEDEGIVFTEIPYTPRNNINIKENDLQDRNGNCLLFNDTISVHGLFNFLLNWKLNQNFNEIFIPILISPNAFLNSSIKLNQLSKNSIVKRSIYNAKQRKNITDEIYQFTIKGFILPSSYYEIIHLLIGKYNNNNNNKIKNKNNNIISPAKKNEGLFIEMLTDTRTIGMNIFKNNIKKNEKSSMNNNNIVNLGSSLKQLLYFNNIYYFND